MTFKFENYIYDVELFGSSNAYCQTIFTIKGYDKDRWYIVYQLWGDEGHAVNNGDKYDIPPTSINKADPEKENLAKRIIIKSVLK
jgi:hypothetical protein